MSRESSSGLEIACALLFAAALWGFRASLFIARVARNLRNEWSQHDQPSQRIEKK
jgi:hypothetical protein